MKRVALKDFSKEFKKFAEGKLQEEFKAIVADEVVSSIPRLVEKTPVDTAEMASSWDFEATKEKISLGNFAPHAVFIEYGVRPHKPPIGPLLAWAKRKLQDPSQPPDYSPEVWRLARGVQKKIEERGQEPHHILQNEIEVIVENVKRQAKKLEEVKP